MRNTWYSPGKWNSICDRCGFKFKNTSLKKDWQGLMVCEQDWETRQPLDFLKVRGERLTLPWTRDDPTPNYIEVVYNLFPPESGVTPPAPPVPDPGYDYFQYIGAPSIGQLPTQSWVAGDFAFSTDATEYGTYGSKYVLLGWRRITTGSGNVLNVDWVEVRMLTGR